ncbi:MAG: DUF58 domain-containing protein, partial [Pseudomonadota bacterium]
MLSLSELRHIVLRPFRAKQYRAQSVAKSGVLSLDFDELVAMRERHPSFRRSQKIDGFRFGEQLSRKRGIGIELEGIGPYQWGDDIRHMDWFATARTGRPQIKQFRRDVQQKLILVVDLRPSMMFGSAHQLMAKTACLAAAKIAWSTSADHQPMGMMLVGHRTVDVAPPRHGRRARLQHMAQLVGAYHREAAYVGNATETFGPKLKDLPSLMAGDVEAIIISDFSHLGGGFDRCLRDISARGRLSAVVVEDQLMQTPPPGGFYPFRSREAQEIVPLAFRTDATNLYQRQ